MKQKWDYQNYIDLEYLFHEDIDDPPARLHERDRNIFLEKGGQPDDNPPDHHGLISLWLDERIHHEFPGKENKSPGEIFLDSHSALKVLLVILGIILGVGAGLSFFTYSGTTPVNVFHFLIFFVFSQILLTFLLAFSLLFRRLTGTAMSLPSFYSLFFGKLFKKLIQVTSRQWNKNLSASKRDSANQAMGLVKSQGRKYGSLFYWPLFTLSQIVTFFFNIGLLGATLFKISTSDLAFGWQSTLQFGAASLYKIIQLIALPWSWFIPSAIAYPSLEEIDGSRILLKEGIYHLATKDLVAWWPFLIFCLLFYGLFFRGICYLGGKWMEKRSLQKIRLNSAPCRRVIQRMLTPLVSTQAQPELKKAESEAIEGKETFQPTVGNHLFPQYILVPDDIYNTLPMERFEQILNSLGFAVKEQLKFMTDYDSDQEIKGYLQQQPWDNDTGLLILMEGWMVPLIDFLTYVKELRSVTTKETVITIALIGRPAKTVFTTVLQDDYTIWRKKIQALGDPYLNLFPLTPDKKKQPDYDS